MKNLRTLMQKKNLKNFGINREINREILSRIKEEFDAT